MMSRSEFVQPPRLATWLINLFTPDEDPESILGDLLEEFSELGSKSGVAFARRWYWRQTIRTIAHLAGSGFRAAPWSTTAAVVGGFLLGKFVSGLPDKLLSAVTDRYLVYWSAHFKFYMFWATDGMLIAHLLLSMFVGGLVALAAKGREMLATMALGLVLCAMGAATCVVMVARTGDPAFLRMLALQFADSFAMAIGGLIVRRRRIATASLPSKT